MHGRPLAIDRCAGVGECFLLGLYTNRMKSDATITAVTLTDPNRAPMPDVARHRSLRTGVLDWVGMERIALPLRLDAAQGELLTTASADVFVDLCDAHARGIHMSRLYLRLQESLAATAISPARLREVLRSCIESQQGLSSRARLRLRYSHLALRAALVSEHRGWKSYPVEIDAQLDADRNSHLLLRTEVEYSSTCPASAALSRQVNAERFAAHFGAEQADAAMIREWLASEPGMAATPHAQRSRAQVEVQLRDNADALPVMAVIDAVEAALATPVQTAVKRQDEQAFAENNAANLMFCEDAARRIVAALRPLPFVAAYEITAVHLESLHAHDAVARASGRIESLSPHGGCNGT